MVWLVGLVLLASGIATVIVAGVGVGPLDVVTTALVRGTALSIGAAIFLLNVAMAVAARALGARVRVATVLTALALGPLVDVIITVLDRSELFVGPGGSRPGRAVAVDGARRRHRADRRGWRTADHLGLGSQPPRCAGRCHRRRHVLVDAPGQDRARGLLRRRRRTRRRRARGGDPAAGGRGRSGRRLGARSPRTAARTPPDAASTTMRPTPRCRTLPERRAPRRSHGLPGPLQRAHLLAIPLRS